MLYFYVFIILQIVVESFPISSSGHTKLFSFLVSYCGGQLPEIIFETWFTHLLHVPMVIIVALFFKKRWFPLLFYPCRYKKIIIRCIGTIFIADGITTLLYVVFRYYGTQWFPLGLGFAITAGVLFLDRHIQRKQSLIKSNYFLLAVILGLVQGFALLPGISRFALTYVCAHWFTRDARTAFAFSWMIVFPLIVVGSMHGLVGLSLYGRVCELLHPALGFVIIGSSIAAWFGLCLVYSMACKHTFYRWWLYMLAPFFMWVFLMV